MLKNAEDYPWSSAKAHVLGVRGDILSGNVCLEEKKLETYRDFLREEDREIETLIRKVTSTGRPLGAERFTKRLENMLARNILPKKAGLPKEKMKK